MSDRNEFERRFRLDFEDARVTAKQIGLLFDAVLDKLAPVGSADRELWQTVWLRINNLEAQLTDLALRACDARTGDVENETPAAGESAAPRVQLH